MKKSFTLVELLVVIAVIGILAGILDICGIGCDRKNPSARCHDYIILEGCAAMEDHRAFLNMPQDRVPGFV